MGGFQGVSRPTIKMFHNNNYVSQEAVMNEAAEVLVKGFINILLGALLNALFVKILWNSHKRFKDIIKLSYLECYFICASIAIIAS